MDKRTLILIISEKKRNPLSKHNFDFECLENDKDISYFKKIMKENKLILFIKMKMVNSLGLNMPLVLFLMHLSHSFNTDFLIKF